jgi:hypothetical protein
MSHHFNWHNLSPDMRLGQSPDDLLTLYRGFAPHQLDPEKGMLSAALLHDQPASIEDAIQAVEQGVDLRLIDHIAIHAVSSDPSITGKYTPFVSATPDRDIALKYAQRSGGKLARIEVQADQVVTVPMLPYEALILGSVGVDSIIDVEDIEVTERKRAPYLYAPINWGDGVQSALSYEPLVSPTLFDTDL